jgi:tetratricopeptide (TPR) repeat protein
MPAEHQAPSSAEAPVEAATPATAEVPRRRFSVPHWRELLLCLLLAGVTGGVYSRACRNGFVNYDDNVYVEQNDEVQKGLTLETVRWAFTTTEMVNWHPLTWLSFELDDQVFGLKPYGYHLTNLVLHVLDTLLLFAALRALTGAVWRSGFVAALFALHPLHVESVAWVSERKDTLSTLFWTLALLAYAFYARRPGALRYPLVAVPFALGLLAKSMVVTLPCVLLLLDGWPLGRLRPAAWSVLGLLLEKVPLFLLAAASCTVTMWAQGQGGESNPAGEMPLRLEHAAVSYVGYLAQTFWPHDLIPFHRFPTHLFPPWQVAWAAGLLLLISSGCVLLTRRSPYLLVGWLWYLGTLVPVVGVVQVLGGHGMADRYTYVPLIGVFLMVVWGVADLAAWLRVPAVVPGAAGVAVLAACAWATWVQIGYWQDNTTLWNHTLAIDPDNYLANNNLGTVLLTEGHVDEAMDHYKACLRANPGYALAHYNMGCALAEKGQTRDAIREYQMALHYNSQYADAHNNLGALLLMQGDVAGAIREFRATLVNAANPALAHNNLGLALARQGKMAEALAEFQEAVRLNPGYADAHNNLGEALFSQGQVGPAIDEFKEALRLYPGFTQAQANLDRALRKQRSEGAHP